MATHQGKYTIRNPDKYTGNPNEVVYRSGWEKYCFIWADMTSDVVSWSSEEVVIPYKFDLDKRTHRYFVDMKIKFKDGKTLLVEIKPYKETIPPVYPGKKTARYLNESVTYVKNKNKWKAAEKYAAERGWEFVTWTENELQAMGIMPKPIERLKPLRTKSKGPKKLPSMKKPKKKS